MLIGPKIRYVWLLGFCVLVNEEFCDLTSGVCIFVDMGIRSKCIPVCWMMLLGRVLVCGSNYIIINLGIRSLAFDSLL